MDLLYATTTDVFCIVSSDSDFTRLATRLRESGKRVYGIGARTAAVAFRNACDRYTYLDLLQPAVAVEDADADRAVEPPAPPRSADPVAAAAPAARSNVNTHPTFDSRGYGHPELGALVRDQTGVEVETRKDADGNGHLWVRLETPA